MTTHATPALQLETAKKLATELAPIFFDVENWEPRTRNLLHGRISITEGDITIHVD